MDLRVAKDLYLADMITSIRDSLAVSDNFGNLVNAADYNAYINYKVLIEEIKVLFLKYRNNYSNHPASRLRLYLIQLEEYRKSKDRDKFTVMKKLIEAFDLPAFSPGYQQIFKEGIELLEVRIDYFCSYTTRGLPAFNNGYEIAINKQFGGGGAILEGWNSTNYLAKMIVRFFNDHGFNGFFDQESLVNGDKIKEKVDTYCAKTNVFVQILEQRSFVKNQDEINWCFREYSTYRDNVNSRYIFYRHPMLVAPEDYGEDIIAWYNFAVTTEGVLSKAIDLNWNNLQILDLVNADAKIISGERKALFQKLLMKIA